MVTRPETANLALICTVAAGLCLAAQQAPAQEVNWSWGVDLTSNYVFAGVTQSDDKAAIQPWVEVEMNGAYFSIWASTVDLPPDNWEIDFFLGYRGTTRYDLNWDVSLARYTYDSTGDCCGEVRLYLSYPVTPGAEIGAYAAYNPETGDWNRFLDASYDIADGLAVSGSLGKSDGMGTTYWDIGTSYAIDGRFSADLRYYGADVGDAGMVLSLSLGF